MNASDRIDEALQSKSRPSAAWSAATAISAKSSGSPNQWAVDVVRRVGNCGEIFERNLGTGSALGIPRGINQLCSLGGIQSAPPIE